MSTTVKKPFNTVVRRFKPGDPVMPSDNLEPFTWASLFASGYIETAPPEISDDTRKPRLPK